METELLVDHRVDVANFVFEFWAVLVILADPVERIRAGVDSQLGRSLFDDLFDSVDEVALIRRMGDVNNGWPRRLVRFAEHELAVHESVVLKTILHLKFYFWPFFPAWPGHWPF